MKIFWDEETHLADFIRLNHQWIEQHFELEALDYALAADPAVILRNGGHILSVVDGDEVIGVCALIPGTDESVELARMAVDPAHRGKGIGKLILEKVIAFAELKNYQSLYLVSNTCLEAALHLYRKSGFTVVTEGQHAVYRRGNITLQKKLG